MNKKGKIFVITAPSGAGKGTIISKILEKDNKICLSISATTRNARDGEIDGVHYHFLTKEQFEEKIEQNYLLEYAKYADNYYGTPLDYINKKTDEGFDVIVEIEVQGARSVRKICPEATLIFITPPSFEELRSRLVNRATETIDVIEKRLEIAKEELKEVDKFDYVVVNDVVETACDEILNIIRN